MLGGRGFGSQGPQVGQQYSRRKVPQRGIAVDSGLLGGIASSVLPADCRRPAVGRACALLPAVVRLRAMDWSELERRQPALAGLGRRRLLEPGVVLIATIRGDGAPRVS